METKNKLCGRCGNYDAFYRKCYSCFQKLKMGYCFQCQQVVTKDKEGCEKWRSNFKRRKIRRSVVYCALDKTITDILTIKQILSEEQEENQVEPLNYIP